AAGGEPPPEGLLRPYFGMHRFEWPDDQSVEFHIGHGDMIRLLRRCGFEVEDLIEVQPPEGATTRWPLASIEWARQWPTEEIWKARKTRSPRRGSGPARARPVDLRGQDLAAARRDQIGLAHAQPLGGHDEQCPAIRAAERAGEAAPVQRDDLRRHAA